MLRRVALGTLGTGNTNSGFDSPRGQKIFSLPRVVPCFPLLGLTRSGLFMDLSSTLIYTSVFFNRYVFVEKKSRQYFALILLTDKLTLLQIKI